LEEHIKNHIALFIHTPAE